MSASTRRQWLRKWVGGTGASAGTGGSIIAGGSVTAGITAGITTRVFMDITGLVWRPTIIGVARNGITAGSVVSGTVVSGIVVMAALVAAFTGFTEDID